MNHYDHTQGASHDHAAGIHCNAGRGPCEAGELWVLVVVDKEMIKWSFAVGIVMYVSFDKQIE